MKKKHKVWTGIGTTTLATLGSAMVYITNEITTIEKSMKKGGNNNMAATIQEVSAEIKALTYTLNSMQLKQSIDSAKLGKIISDLTTVDIKLDMILAKV